MHHASLHHQLTELVSWASERIACLDAQELYEESFALTEELREWILCLEEHPDRVAALLVPPTAWLTDLERKGRNPREMESMREPRLTDGLLEI